MDFINMSASMTMLELVRFLLQSTNNSFSFYSGKLSNIFFQKRDTETNKRISTVCQHICKNVRETWTVHNIGIITVNEEELMICVTSPDPSVPAEVVSFMVEAIAVCSVHFTQENSRMTVDGVEDDDNMDEDISPNLIQVNASMKEINERIEQFIRYKRDQSNANNVLDFCGSSADGERQFCARVDAVLVRKKDSSSHMAVRNVLDRYTSKYNIKKQEQNEKPLEVMTRSQEHMSSDQMLPLPNPQISIPNQKGEKRTYDIASLESLLDSTKKQQRC